MGRGGLVTDVQAAGRLYSYLADGLRVRLDSASYSATASWMILELARQDAIELMELRHRTGIEPGYLSRLLAGFQANELVTMQRSPADARRQIARFTPRGRAVCAAIDGRVEEAVRRRCAASPRATGCGSPRPWRRSARRWRRSSEAGVPAEPHPGASMPLSGVSSGSAAA